MISLSLWFRMLYGMFTDIFACFRIALLPTLRTVRDNPKLLLKPGELSQTFMNFVWGPFGEGIDQNGREEKERLITPWASGVVFEIGAAHGHLVRYLDRTRVTAYIALEPNANMHERLREKAREFGFEEETGSFLLLPYGVEDTEIIGRDLEVWARKWTRPIDDGRTVDTIVSILTLCSVPARPSTAPPQDAHSLLSTPPAETVRALQSRILRPGGQFLFYEHVRSPIPSVALAQDILAPLWKAFFDGCTIGVDSVRAIWEAGFEAKDLRSADAADILKGYVDWSEKDGVKCWKPEGGRGWVEMYIWGKKGEDNDPASLFWHQLGRCVKQP